MNAMVYTKYGSPEVIDFQEVDTSTSRDTESVEAFIELKRGVQAALET